MSGLIIDVSSYQGLINWPAIAADQIELAIIKATEGIGFTDPRFAQNWAGAAAAEVRRGAYHFAHPDAGNSAVAEADYFVSVLKAHGLSTGDVLAEDYEVLGGGASWSLNFLTEVERLSGILPEFYSNYSGCSRVQDSRMAQYPLWLAYPGDGVHAPFCPAPWRSIALWQYRVGTVNGISGGVDEDVSLGLFASGANLLVAHPHTHQEDSNMVVLTNHPTGRVDAVLVGTDGNLYHLSAPNQPAFDAGPTYAGIPGVNGNAVLCGASWNADFSAIEVSFTGRDHQVYRGAINDTPTMVRAWVATHGAKGLLPTDILPPAAPAADVDVPTPLADHRHHLDATGGTETTGGVA